MSEPLTNGHDTAEADGGVLILREQLFAIRAGAARQAERQTIEALAQDALRRLADAYKTGNHNRAAEITREILRLEVYLSRRGIIGIGERWRMR